MISVPPEKKNRYNFVFWRLTFLSLLLLRTRQLEQNLRPNQEKTSTCQEKAGSKRDESCPPRHTENLRLMRLLLCAC